MRQGGRTELSLCERGGRARDGKNSGESLLVTATRVKEKAVRAAKVPRFKNTARAAVWPAQRPPAGFLAIICSILSWPLSRAWMQGRRCADHSSARERHSEDCVHVMRRPTIECENAGSSDSTYATQRCLFARKRNAGLSGTIPRDPAVLWGDLSP